MFVWITAWLCQNCSQTYPQFAAHAADPRLWGRLAPVFGARPPRCFLALPRATHKKSPASVEGRRAWWVTALEAGLLGGCGGLARAAAFATAHAAVVGLAMPPVAAFAALHATHAVTALRLGVKGLLLLGG